MLKRVHDPCLVFLGVGIDADEDQPMRIWEVAVTAGSAFITPVVAVVVVSQSGVECTRCERRAR